MSAWEYSYEFKLAQENCGSWEADYTARGFSKYDGCPSCIHHKPHNVETEIADLKYAQVKE